jgi:hypothetical protein
MKSQLAEVQTGFEPPFFHIQADYQWQRPFSEGRDDRFSEKTKKNLSQNYGRWIVGFHEPMTRYCMSKELTPQKERFLREVEQKLLHRELDARLLEDGLIHVRWNEKPLCSVDRDGIVRFRPADITGPEVDKQLRTVVQTADHVKEYMRIFERAPALKAVGLDDTYKVLADFGDAVLAGRSCKTGAKFVTWEWDFDRQGVHAGHYFMENYEAAKQDFAVRAGLIESQRLFSDEQLAVIRNACEFALEDDATLSYAEEKQLQSVQEQIEVLLPQQEQGFTMEQTM